MKGRAAFLLPEYQVSIDECHFRNDGILIFSLCLTYAPATPGTSGSGTPPPAGTAGGGSETATKGKPNGVPYESLIAVAAYISNEVKTLIGHTHLYDTDFYERRKKNRFPSIAKHPVLIDSSSLLAVAGELKLDDVLRDNKKLMDLYSSNRNGDRRRSVLLIRERFSKIFDKSFTAIAQVKRNKFAGIHIFRHYYFISTLAVLACALYSLIDMTAADKPNTIITGLFNFIFAIALPGTMYLIHAKHFAEFSIFKPIYEKARTSLRRRVSGVAEWLFTEKARQGTAAFFKQQGPRILIALVLTSPVILASDLFQPVAGSPSRFVLGDRSEYFAFDDMLSRFSLNGFLYGLIDNILSILWVCAAAIFITEISIKRRKILQILHRAKGIMQFGSIYNGVVQNIASSVDALRYHNNACFLTFENAYSILDSRIALEKRKRTRTYILCASMALVSLAWHFRAHLPLP
ncbi:hypothetical protein [Azospirillum sp.]|uniref:hypothetical protein n=1 Tax=Azospirillum sp. TaxID=34012 RepID=UPI003D70EF50